MTRKYKFSTRPLVIQGDIHINCRLNFEFEQQRIKALAEVYLTAVEKQPSILVLAGDIFDSDSPSLLDIKLFYEFIELLKPVFTIFVISGNHDCKVFTFLPQSGYTYIHTEAAVTIGATYFNLVSWWYLPKALENTSDGKTKKWLVSHARCSYGKFIKEEVSFKLLSEMFEYVVLGDIHNYYQPYDNITYTSSPSAIYFSNEKAAYGFIKVVKKKIQFIPITIPSKKLKIFDNVDLAVAFIKSLKQPKDLYKLKITCTTEEVHKIRHVSHPNVKKEIYLKVSEIKTEQYKESLSLIKDFLSEKADITKHLFAYVGEKKKVSNNTVINYLNMFKQEIFKKGIK